MHLSLSRVEPFYYVMIMLLNSFNNLCPEFITVISPFFFPYLLLSIRNVPPNKSDGLSMVIALYFVSSCCMLNPFWLKLSSPLSSFILSDFGMINYEDYTYYGSRQNSWFNGSLANRTLEQLIHILVSSTRILESLYTVYFLPNLK